MQQPKHASCGYNKGPPPSGYYGEQTQISPQTSQEGNPEDATLCGGEEHVAKDAGACVGCRLRGLLRAAAHGRRTTSSPLACKAKYCYSNAGS